MNYLVAILSVCLLAALLVIGVLWRANRRDEIELIEPEDLKDL